MDILFRGILKLQTVEDCYDFFEDLCTIAELRAMVGGTFSAEPQRGDSPSADGGNVPRPAAGQEGRHLRFLPS